MLNQAPVFVNGCSRGGTSLLVNLIASHPDVCFIGDTHHAFKGHHVVDSSWSILRKCLYNEGPILASLRQDFFSPRLIEERKPLSRWARRRIDRVLYRQKFRSHPYLTVSKNSDSGHDTDDVAESRLLCKNIDGMIFANDELAAMYADATFFGLVRHGLAVCEGHIRRGGSAREVGKKYRRLVEKMFLDSERLTRYHLIRFEDLVNQPVETLNRILMLSGLDISRINAVQLPLQRVMDRDGNHRLRGHSEREIRWLKLHELNSFFDSNVDDSQINQLKSDDVGKFMDEAETVMEWLGYDADTAPETQANIFRIDDFRPAPNSRNQLRRKAA